MDFQEYLRIVRKRWPLVLACVLLIFAVGLILVALSTQAYEAEADLVFLKSGALLNLEPKYQTVSDLNSATDIASRRRALIAIGKSPALAASVIAKLGDQLEAIERLPTALLQKVDITIDGDAIKVKARAATAQKAATLANAW